MTRRGDRNLGRILWAFSIALELAALAVMVDVILARRPGSSLSTPGHPRVPGAGGIDLGRAKDLEALAKKPMSRALVKVAPPPAPPAPKPPLEALVRLAGIMEYGASLPAEAIIEAPPGGRSKGYRAGDTVAIAGTRVTVTKVSDVVWVEYEGKRWVLSLSGGRGPDGRQAATETPDGPEDGDQEESRP